MTAAFTWRGSSTKDRGNASELKISLANLREIQKKLQIRGALADQLQVEEKQVASQLSDRENRRTKSRSVSDAS